MSEANFTSHDGMRLYMKKDVPADAKVICVVVHGLCEHQGRYDYLVGKFNAAGIGTYRFDHRGHGRSEGERTYYENFHDMIDDAKAVVDVAKAENPDKPVFLLGHSMGGFCVSLFGAKYPGAVKGIVMSGALTHDNRRLIADIPAGQDVHGRIPNQLGDGGCLLCSLFFISDLAALGEDSDNINFSEDEQLLADLGAQIVKDPTNVSDEIFEQLKKKYTDSEIVAIVGFAAQMMATNNFNSVLRIDVDERLLPIRDKFRPATWRADIK